jgi:hypothetical protein
MGTYHLAKFIKHHSRKPPNSKAGKPEDFFSHAPKSK